MCAPFCTCGNEKAPCGKYTSYRVYSEQHTWVVSLGRKHLCLLSLRTCWCHHLASVTPMYYMIQGFEKPLYCQYFSYDQYMMLHILDKSLSKYLIDQRILVDRVGEIDLHGFIFHIEATFFFLACWFSDTGPHPCSTRTVMPHHGSSLQLSLPLWQCRFNPGPSTCLVRGSGLSYFSSLAKIW